MDKHALEAPLSENLPVLMSLLAYWDSTKLEIPSMCLLPYDCRFDMMPAWLQQLEMESLGKTKTISGEKTVSTRTGQEIWGGNGNKSQHSFFQWLREGSWNTSINLVEVKNPGHSHKKMEKVLSSNVTAQSDALIYRDSHKYFNSLTVTSLDVNFQRFPTLDAKKLVNAPKMSAHHRGICHF